MSEAVITTADGGRYRVTKKGWVPADAATEARLAEVEARRPQPQTVPDAPFLSPPTHGDLFAGAAGFEPVKLGKFIEREAHLRLGPDGKPWRYVGGVYRPDGGDYIAQRVRDILGEEFRAARLREVIAWCEANTASRLETEPTTEFINLTNGLLYWKEDPPRLAPHSPEVGSVIQLPVAWNPDAECPSILSFLLKVLPPDDETYSFLIEWIGYCLIPSQRFKRALMLLGPTDTAKSTLLALIGELLGKENVSNATLQGIAEDRFTSGSLYGKLANIAADLDARALKTTGMFKTMTGGEDRIQSDRKYRDHINFRPTARLMFSANEAPGTSDQSEAYYNRWEILPMTRVVGEEDQDRNLIDAMTSPEELSGLLRFAVAGLKQLMERGRFVPSPVMREALADYRRRTDTVVGHAEERIVFDVDGRTRASALYQDYKQWCDTSSRHPLGQQRYKDQLLAAYGSRIEFKPRLHGYPTWAGLSLATPEN